MNGAEVRAAIVATVAALTPAGGKLSGRDGFREVLATNPGQGSRSFVVEVLEWPVQFGPSIRGIGAGTRGAREFVAVFGLAVIYELTELDRGLKDCEGIVDALMQLPSTYAQIINVDPIDTIPARTDIEFASNSRVRLAAYRIRVVYDARELS